MRRLAGLVERTELGRLGAMGAAPTTRLGATNTASARPGSDAETWRTMSDIDLAKHIDALRKRTKALLDSLGSVAPSAREVDRSKMDKAYPEMQKMFAAFVSEWNALT